MASNTPMSFTMHSNDNVKVIDNLIADSVRENLFRAVAWIPVYFMNRAERYGSHELDMHWFYPIAVTDDPDNEDVEPALRQIDDTLRPIIDAWDAIKSTIGQKVRLYECMVSANTFGTEGQPHHDINDKRLRPNHIIALLYCNPRWELAWAGETLFFDESGEITAAVIPKPGRLVIARGDQLHVGRSVTRICPSDRRVLAFKMWVTP